MEDQGRRNFIKLSGLLAASTVTFPSKILSKTADHVSIKTIKPPKLAKGDTIAIAGLAGAVWDQNYVSLFTNTLTQLGFKIKVGENVRKKFGYLSGTDEDRANELNAFFEDSSVKGIFCIKGGWGSARIIDLIDYELIKKNPKVFLGFSDITSLLNSMYAKTGLVTFHGPVGYSTWNAFSIEALKNVLFTDVPTYFPTAPLQNQAFQTLKSGYAKGEMVGGNLSVICSIIGSGYLPNWENKILFLEETNEEPYRIDRMLTTLRLTGAFDKINGIVLGQFTHCEPENPLTSFSLIEVLKQHVNCIDVPVFIGAPIGHVSFKWTIPVGLRCEMNADLGTLKMLESAVS